MYAETVRPSAGASDRGALVSHLLSHLARLARAMRVATQLSAAPRESKASLTMRAVLPVLRDEQEMLRALLLTLAEPAGTTWHSGGSWRVRGRRPAPIAPRSIVRSAAGDAYPVARSGERVAIEGQESVLGAGVFDTLLDVMIEGSWGRLALWRALSERSRLTSPHHAVDFSALARRTQLMIGELESLQEGVAVSH